MAKRLCQQDLACAEGFEIGDADSDGAIFAGEFGDHCLFAAPTDESGTLTWNNGTANWPEAGTTSTANGLSNTDILTGLSGAASPYAAAEACRSKGSAWFLPAFDQLNVLHVNQSDIGGFSGGIYWSSSEYPGSSHEGARVQRFSDGLTGSNAKESANLVRCVRHELPPDTTYPQWETYSPPAMPEAVAGVAYNATITVQATDNSGTVIYSYSMSPADWLDSFDTETGEISGTPPIYGAGIYNLTVQAADPSGNGGIQNSFQIRVRENCEYFFEVGCASPDDGAIYAGELSGTPLYAAPHDENQLYTWNNGSSGTYPSTSATSHSDGLSNTDHLVGRTGSEAPYRAAHACRDRGNGWYLPAIDELSLLHQNRNSIGSFNQTPIDIARLYWTSVDTGYSILGDYLQAFQADFSSASYTPSPVGKGAARSVRCVRQ